MVVGVMALYLALYDNSSLKAKRSVVKRLIHRTRNTFNVSVAEVEDQDLTDRATLGCVAVGSSKTYVEGMLTKIQDFVERQALADLLEAPISLEVY
jgi:uncharacterized protein